MNSKLFFALTLLALLLVSTQAIRFTDPDLDPEEQDAARTDKALGKEHAPPPKDDALKHSLQFLEAELDDRDEAAK